MKLLGVRSSLGKNGKIMTVFKSTIITGAVIQEDSCISRQCIVKMAEQERPIQQAGGIILTRRTAVIYKVPVIYRSYSKHFTCTRELQKVCGKIKLNNASILMHQNCDIRAQYFHNAYFPQTFRKPLLCTDLTILMYQNKFILKFHFSMNFFF